MSPRVPARRSDTSVAVRFDVAMDVVERTLWSHTCSWTELAMAETVFDEARRQLVLDSDWSRRWMATGQFADGDVVASSRQRCSHDCHLRCRPVRRNHSGLNVLSRTRVDTTSCSAANAVRMEWTGSIPTAESLGPGNEQHAQLGGSVGLMV
jgi:hypothetical protein